MKIGFFVGHEHYIPHATLLCKSLLEFFPMGKDCEIVAVIPNDLRINLRIPNVSQIRFDIPSAFRHIPFADKIAAAAAFENQCKSRYLWMDVDGYFFQPVAFPAIPEILINPVDQKNIGDLFKNERSDLWRILYDSFSLSESNAPVITRVSQERIDPYFNIGMVVVNQKRDLFNISKDAISRLLRREDVKNLLHSSLLHSIFFHQAVLTCAVLQRYEGQRISELPYGTNYPLHLHANNRSPIPLEDLVSIRYDSFFENNEIPAQWKHIFAASKSQLVNTWYY